MCKGTEGSHRAFLDVGSSWSYPMSAITQEAQGYTTVLLVVDCVHC